MNIQCTEKLTYNNCHYHRGTLYFEGIHSIFNAQCTKMVTCNNCIRLATGQPRKELQKKSDNLSVTEGQGVVRTTKDLAKQNSRHNVVPRDSNGTRYHYRLRCRCSHHPTIGCMNTDNKHHSQNTRERKTWLLLHSCYDHHPR